MLVEVKSSCYLWVIMQKITVNGGDGSHAMVQSQSWRSPLGERKRQTNNKKHTFKFLRKGSLRTKRWIFFSPVKLEIKAKSPPTTHKHMNNFSFVFPRRRICMWTIQWLITCGAISYVWLCHPQATNVIFPFRVVLYLDPWSFIWE